MKSDLLNAIKEGNLKLITDYCRDGEDEEKFIEVMTLGIDDKNRKPSQQGLSALFLAAQRKQTGIVNFIIETALKNINTRELLAKQLLEKNDQGRNVLQETACTGNERTIEKLCEAARILYAEGVDVTESNNLANFVNLTEDEDGNTALHISVRQTNFSNYQALIAAKADPTIRAKNGGVVAFEMLQHAPDTSGKAIFMKNWLQQTDEGKSYLERRYDCSPEELPETFSEELAKVEVELLLMTDNPRVRAQAQVFALNSALRLVDGANTEKTQAVSQAAIAHIGYINLKVFTLADLTMVDDRDLEPSRKLLLMKKWIQETDEGKSHLQQRYNCDMKELPEQFLDRIIRIELILLNPRLTNNSQAQLSAFHIVLQLLHSADAKAGRTLDVSLAAIGYVNFQVITAADLAKNPSEVLRQAMDAAKEITELKLKEIKEPHLKNNFIQAEILRLYRHHPQANQAAFEFYGTGALISNYPQLALHGMVGLNTRELKKFTLTKRIVAAMAHRTKQEIEIAKSKDTIAKLRSLLMRENSLQILDQFLEAMHHVTSMRELAEKIKALSDEGYVGRFKESTLRVLRKAKLLYMDDMLPGACFKRVTDLLKTDAYLQQDVMAKYNVGKTYYIFKNSVYYTLLSLFRNPSQQLDKEALKLFEYLQVLLNHPEEKVKNAARFAVCIALLSSSYNDYDSLVNSLTSCFQTPGTPFRLVFPSDSVFPTEMLPVLGAAVSCLRPASLDFCYSGTLVEKERVEGFLELIAAIRSLNLNTLSVEINHIYFTDDNVWREICSVFVRPTILSCMIPLDRFEGQYLKIIADAIVTSNIQTLHLLGTGIARTKADDFDHICRIVMIPTLKSFSSQDVNFTSATFTANKMRLWCSAIAKSSFTELRLWNSVFRNSNISVCGEDFWKAVIASKIRRVDLSGSQFADNMSWNFLIPLLKNNLHLAIKGLPDSIPDELKNIIARNNIIAETMDEEDIEKAEDLLKLAEKPSPLVVELSKRLGIEIPKEIEAEEFAKQLNTVKDMDVKFAGTFLGNLLDETHMRRAFRLKDQLDATEACNTYLQVSSRTECYQQAHFNAFEAMFESIMSGNKGDKDDISKQQAFVMALPCCLDADHQLMSDQNVKLSSKFNEDQQRVFDGILFNVAGGPKTNIKRIFSAEERKALLQYVILMEMQSKIKPGSEIVVAATGPGFFQNSKMELKTYLENKLAEFTFQSCLLPEPIDGTPVKKPTLMQIAIQKLWDDMVQQVKDKSELISVQQVKGEQKLISNEDFKILISAITELDVVPVAVPVIVPAAAAPAPVATPAPKP